MTATLTIHQPSMPDNSMTAHRRVIYEFPIQMEDIQDIVIGHSIPEHVLVNSIGKQFVDHLMATIGLLIDDPANAVTINRKIEKIDDIRRNQQSGQGEWKLNDSDEAIISL